MAAQEHFERLKQGVETWNTWRREHQGISPDFTGAYLMGVDLRSADLRNADLSEAFLSGANLSGAFLSGANLMRAHLTRGVNLSGADLRRAVLVGTIFERANLTGASIYGVSAWSLQLKDANQSNLVITDKGKPIITVDNLEVAQFIYLLLNNERIRQVIDTITSKVVLILGRFTPERKAVLDALREELRKQDYLPVLFDFEKPKGRDFTETVSTLAHLARFIIADLTEPNSIPHEVATIIPQCKVPVQPLLIQSASIREYSMFRDLTLYPWVLPIFRYQDTMSLLTSLKEHVIAPAEQKAQELAKLKQAE